MTVTDESLSMCHISFKFKFKLIILPSYYNRTAGIAQSHAYWGFFGWPDLLLKSLLPLFRLHHASKGKSSLKKEIWSKCSSARKRKDFSMLVVARKLTIYENARDKRRMSALLKPIKASLIFLPFNAAFSIYLNELAHLVWCIGDGGLGDRWQSWTRWKDSPKGRKTSEGANGGHILGIFLLVFPKLV